VLHYRTYELGPDRDWVVLVHGAGGSSSIWFRQLRAYREKFNVLLVDLRGHGASADITGEVEDDVASNHFPEPYTFEVIAADVLEVLDHLGIQRAHFVGISLGSMIIRTIAEVAPARVQSMVLGGAILRLTKRSRILVFAGNAVKRFIPFMWLYRLYAWILMPRLRHRESRMVFVREARKLARQEFLRWWRLTLQLTPLLRIFEEREVDIPTLYLMGEEDHMFLPPVRAIVERHRSAVLHVIQRCGHVCNIEQPDAFNEVSISFMNSHAGS
jgi:pimeloyl-ACP methyl ester carboxylesterase